MMGTKMTENNEVRLGLDRYRYTISYTKLTSIGV